jgi:hypothetical protein
MHGSVCAHAVHIPLTPEQLDGCHSYTIFNSLSITGWCLANMSTASLKIGTLQMPPPPPKKEEKILNFLNVNVIAVILIMLFCFMETIFLHKTALVESSGK